MMKNNIYNNLIKEMQLCKACDLCKNRKQIVHGSGKLNSKILFIGEAPGQKEDEEGIPFVGRSGKDLSTYLSLIGLKREDVFITNTVKCRPPNNRNPKPEELKTCQPFLDEQINLIKPKVIVPLGKFATEYVFKRFNIDFNSISVHVANPINVPCGWDSIILYPMFHPAVGLYDPKKKERLKWDFVRLAQILK